MSYEEFQKFCEWLGVRREVRSEVEVSMLRLRQYDPRITNDGLLICAGLMYGARLMYTVSRIKTNMCVVCGHPPDCICTGELCCGAAGHRHQREGKAVEPVLFDYYAPIFGKPPRPYWNVDTDAAVDLIERRVVEEMPRPDYWTPAEHVWKLRSGMRP